MPTLLTANELPYQESARQTVSVRHGGVSVTRYVQIPGGQEQEYAKAFLGWAEVAGTQVVRHPPEMHPKWPQGGTGLGFSAGLGLPATSFEFVRELGEPSQDGLQGDALIFDQCEYAVTYERSEENHGVVYLPDDENPGGTAIELWRNVHRRTDYEAHGVAVPRNVLEFVVVNGGGGHDPVPEAGVQLVYESTAYYTWLGVPNDPYSTDPKLPDFLESNIGRCVLRANSGYLDGLFAPLTVVALPPRRTLRTQANGTMVWDLLFPLAVRGGPDLSAPALDAQATDTPDWTRILRADGKYWKVRRKGAPTKSIYDTAELSYLFSLKSMP
jgi:hypothetical protein